MARVTSTKSGGLETAPLSEAEKDHLDLAFERSLEDTRADDTEVLREKLDEYRADIRYTAEVAKAQFDKKFGGVSPTSDNEFAISPIDAAYFGFDDWDTQFGAGNNTLSAGSTSNWVHEDQYIDSSGTQIGGSAGSPLTVGEDVVHLITGIGSFHPSPKVSRVRFELNDQPKTVSSVGDMLRSTDLQMYWLDAPVLLSKEDEILVEAFSALGGEDVPYFRGVTFITRREARQLDPSSLRNTSSTDTETPISL